MRKVLETDLCKINYSESLQQLVEETITLLNKKISEYKEFFNLSNIEQVTVNYFDDIDEFRNFIYEIRGEKSSLPKYATGTCDNGMVNSFINPKFQSKRLYTASHELFHILYMIYVLNFDYSKRIVWYDEGMAQFMSGENDWLKDEAIFKKFYCEVKENTKMIPRMNELEHGDLFVSENYNGYDLSYLSIRYLHEVLNFEQFKNLMCDFSKIIQYGENIINEMFDYYDEKLISKQK